MSTTKKAGTKKAQITAIKKTEILQSVGGLSLAGVAEQLAKTQVAVQEKLADVSTQMSTSLATLGNVNEAIEAKKEELKALHEIEATALTLDELNGTIQATREAWAEEQKRREQAETERVAEQAKARKRDEDEYGYKTGQERRKRQDEFEAQIAAQQKQQRERTEQLEKGWQQREADLKAREQELADLRAAVAAFPAAKQKEIDAAVAIATNSLKKTLETQYALEKKDAETSLKLAQNATMTAQGEVARLNGAITGLQKQLDEAHRSTQAVAEKALDSASGRSAMEALQNSMSRIDGSPATGGRR